MENNKGKRKVKEEKEDEEISKLVLGIMEGYSDSVIPPLSLFKPGLSESAIDVHSSLTKRAKAENVKERDRRVKMNENFSLLESIVPGLLPKVSLFFFSFGFLFLSVFKWLMGSH